jgi:hypothetical protein
MPAITFVLTRIVSSQLYRRERDDQSITPAGRLSELALTSMRPVGLFAKTRPTLGQSGDAFELGIGARPSFNADGPGGISECRQLMGRQWACTGGKREFLVGLHNVGFLRKQVAWIRKAGGVAIGWATRRLTSRPLTIVAWSTRKKWKRLRRYPPRCLRRSGTIPAGGRPWGSLSRPATRG